MEQRETDPVELMWRMGKLVGGIDMSVRLIETVIKAIPSLKFQTAAGKELPIRDLAGLARSIQAATSMPHGAPIEESVIKSLEQRLAAVETDTKVMLAQLAKMASA